MKNIKKFWGSLALGLVLLCSVFPAKTYASKNTVCLVFCTDKKKILLNLPKSEDDFKNLTEYLKYISDECVKACGCTDCNITYTYEQVETELPDKPNPGNP